MTRYLLDSSCIIDILSGNERGAKAAQLAKGAELVTSAICYCEVLNRLDLDKAAKAEAFLSKLLVFGLGLQEAKIAKEMQYACRRAGNQVPTVDCLIAATAKTNSATLIASDHDFARIDGVEKKVL